MEEPNTSVKEDLTKPAVKSGDARISDILGDKEIDAAMGGEQKATEIFEKMSEEEVGAMSKKLNFWPTNDRGLLRNPDSFTPEEINKFHADLVAEGVLKPLAEAKTQQPPVKSVATLKTLNEIPVVAKPVEAPVTVSEGVSPVPETKTSVAATESETAGVVESKEPYDLDKYDLKTLDREQGYTQGVSNRQIAYREEIATKYGKDYKKIDPSEMTEREYVNAETSASYPKDVAIEDYHNFVEENKLGDEVSKSKSTPELKKPQTFPEFLADRKPSAKLRREYEQSPSGIAEKHRAIYEAHPVLKAFNVQLGDEAVKGEATPKKGDTLAMASEPFDKFRTNDKKLSAISIGRGFNSMMIQREEYNALAPEKRDRVDALSAEYEQLNPIVPGIDIGPDQVRRMSDRQKEKNSEAILKGNEILREIKQLVKPDIQVAQEQDAESVRKASSRLTQINGQIRTINGLGVMSHKPNGELKPKYQRTVDIYEQERSEILGRHPQLATAPLAKARTKESQDKLSALTDAPLTPKNIESIARPKITKYGVEVDEQGMEIVRLATKAAGLGELQVDGQFQEPKAAKSVIGHLQVLSKGLEAAGHLGAARKVANLAYAFKTDATNHQGTLAVYLYDDAGRHEQGHRLSYLGVPESANKDLSVRYGDLTKIAKTPNFQTAANNWQAKEGRSTPIDQMTAKQLGHAAEEVATYLANGDDLGLSSLEADTLLVDLMRKYAKARIAENSRLDMVTALSHFDGYFSEQLLEKINEKGNEESRGSRKSDDRGGAEPGRSDRGGGTVQTKSETRESEGRGKESVAEPEIAKVTGQTEAEVITKNRKFADSIAREFYDIGKVEYEPRTEQGWMAQSQKTIEGKGIDGAIKEYDALDAKKSEGYKTALGVAIASDLYANGTSEEFADFGRKLTTDIGNIAQELRASQLLSRLSPEHASLIGQQLVEKAIGRKMTPDEFKAMSEKVQPHAMDLKNISEKISP